MSYIYSSRIPRLFVDLTLFHHTLGLENDGEAVGSLRGDDT